MSEKSETVRELLMHECEKHDLLFLGVVTDISGIIRQVSERVETNPDFRQMKENILSRFYEFIDFEKYICQCRSSISDGRLHTSMHRFLGRMLQDMERQSPDISPDRELKVRKTIAYRLSKPVFDDLYGNFRDEAGNFSTPGEVKHFFRERTRARYPLSFTDFMERLENRDNEFWDGVGDLTLKLSQLVTIPDIPSSVHRDVADGEIAGESYLVIKQIVEGKKVQFNDALHFRKYSYNVCKNKCREYMRKSKNHRTDSLEDIFVVPEDDESPADIVEKEEDMMYDVNTDNPYEMAKLLSFILYHKEHPLHRTIVDGEEERVSLLMDIAVEGLSYDGIIDRRYGGKQLPENEHKKLNAKLRQDYVRIKKKLIDRLEKILERNG